MATFDQLSAEQRAILELVLQREQSYLQLASALAMSEERVRELARDALVSLAPTTAPRVDEDWRGQIADYLLLQQSGPESTATRGHLRRSEAGRAWARSLIDSLETLYSNGALPTVPEGDRRGGGRERAERPSRAAAAAGVAAPQRERPSRDGQDPVRRRRLYAGAGAVALLAILLTGLWAPGWFPGVGDDDEGAGGGDSAAAGGRQCGPFPVRGSNPVAGQVVLRPVGGAKGAGIAVFGFQQGTCSMVVQAAQLEATKQREAYEVWLYNSPTDARSLGAQVTDRRGTLQGAAEVSGDIGKYKFIDISRETIDDDNSHSGQSILRGRLPSG